MNQNFNKNSKIPLTFHNPQSGPHFYWHTIFISWFSFLLRLNLLLLWKENFQLIKPRIMFLQWSYLFSRKSPLLRRMLNRGRMNVPPWLRRASLRLAELFHSPTTPTDNGVLLCSGIYQSNNLNKKKLKIILNIQLF